MTVPQLLSFSGLTVGYHPGGPKRTFSDPVEACAEFVTKEIGDLATSAG